MTLIRHLCIQSSFRILALATMAAVASPAGAALIDFESLAIDEFVTNQFAGDGVVFSNGVTLVAGVSLNEFLFPPTSGTNVISGLDLGPLEAAFLAGASHVSLQITTAVTARVSFFDLVDTFLGELLVAPNMESNTLVSFDSASPIGRVSIGDDMLGSAFFLTVDDLEFESSSTPEPSTLALIALGLVSLAATGVRGRRR
jgi:hypothetical protein